MTTVGVVSAFYVFKDRHAGLSLGAEYTAVNEFAFKGREKAFGHSVVKTVSDRSHGRRNAHFAAAFPEGVRCVLAALIAVRPEIAMISGPMTDHLKPL